MVTAPTNNSPRASAVSFGNGVCVLAHPNTLASAIRHVASRPMYVSQSRSAPAVARNRSRSGGGVEPVTMPRGWGSAAPRVELRVPRRTRATLRAGTEAGPTSKPAGAGSVAGAAAMAGLASSGATAGCPEDFFAMARGCVAGHVGVEMEGLVATPPTYCARGDRRYGVLTHGGCTGAPGSLAARRGGCLAMARGSDEVSLSVDFGRSPAWPAGSADRLSTSTSSITSGRRGRRRGLDAAGLGDGA